MELLALIVFIVLIAVISKLKEKKGLNTTTIILLGQFAFLIASEIYTSASMTRYAGNLDSDAKTMRFFSVGLLWYFACTIPVAIIIENASDRNKDQGNAIGFGVLALLASMFLFRMISLLWMKP